MSRITTKRITFNPTEANKTFAREMWDKQSSYDFHPTQMYCDDALLKLDLAEWLPDPDEPEPDEDDEPSYVLCYGPPDDRN